MRAQKHSASGLLMTHLEAYVAPIWASRSVSQSPYDVDHNGTIVFVDLGARKVGVTAFHVLDRYRRERKKFPGTGLAINLGNRVTPFITDVHVIDEDETRDIATISLPGVLDRFGHSKRFFRYKYPAVLPQAGDPMTIVGFPGALRVPTASWGSFSPHGIGMIVSSPPGNNVMLVDTSGSLRTIIERTGKRTSHINPGGMSGSAGSFFYHGEIRIGGFVYEGSPEMIFLVPGSILEPDGRICR